MKNRVFFVLFIIRSFSSWGQTGDSLLNELKYTTADSSKFLINYLLANYYEEWKVDSSLYFAANAANIANLNDQKLAEAAALNSKGYQLLSLGRFGESLVSLRQAYSILKDPSIEKNNWHKAQMKNRYGELSYNHYMFGILMRVTQNQQQELYHYLEAISIADEAGDSSSMRAIFSNMAYVYMELGKPDSALFVAYLATKIRTNPKNKKFIGWQYQSLGWVYYKMNNPAEAKKYFYEGLRNSIEEGNQGCILYISCDMARQYLSEKNKDSSLYYSKKALEGFDHLGDINFVEYNIGMAYELMYHSYKLNDQQDSANKYLLLTQQTQDKLYKARIKSLAEFQALTFNEQLRLQELEKESVINRNRIRTYILLGGISLLLLLSLIVYRNNRQKQKANKLLQQQKEEIQNALSQLKATQAQLIQSEKMASLGELTAGIAHEIQNPLNFVNNFSEVNKELIAELKSEVRKGNTEEVNSIANDIEANEEKITHHGKRAEAIVKGMLQHSRASSNQRELTDINSLADEYVRLAYHGLRAKDKSFYANMKTDFGETIGNVNIVPQDIGRVILNLINNAFYAVDEKKRQESEGYEPIVTVSTRKNNGKVEISIKDNGSGIPQKVLGKIFQPFFTTKPTGQGTGLGLSLSYDIVKAHGGELKVETREREGSEFIIALPIN